MLYGVYPFPGTWVESSRAGSRHRPRRRFPSSPLSPNVSYALPLILYRRPRVSSYIFSMYLRERREVGSRKQGEEEVTALARAIMNDAMRSHSISSFIPRLHLVFDSGFSLFFFFLLFPREIRSAIPRALATVFDYRGGTIFLASHGRCGPADKHDRGWLSRLDVMPTKYRF